MGMISANQSVTGGRGALARLLQSAPYSLADWYATPLAPAEARALQSAALEAIQRRLRKGESCFPLQVLLQICRFWIDGLPGQVRKVTRHMAGSAREAALQALVHGQLLASRKLHPAGVHLSLGFRHAAPLLETADYFRLLRVHELLAYLPLSDQPAVPLDLPALLNEAAVIRRLQRGDRRRPAGPHLDTLG